VNCDRASNITLSLASSKASIEPQTPEKTIKKDIRGTFQSKLETL
jgi:hypothetical protein